jgi:type IV pilus assembly protein PilC
MSHFVFKAKKPSGEIYSGQKDVADRYELYKILRGSNEELVSFKEKKASRGMNMNISFGNIFSRVKTIEKINLARNLGSMLEAGLDLSRALSVLERQTKNRATRDVLTDLISEISKGATFTGSLTKHSKVFPPLFISMVHAGEQSGTLSDSLKAIAVQMDNTYSLERRVRGAMTYPAVIVTAMAVIGVLMFIFVVPTLLKTFTDLNVTLPFTTKVIIAVSDIIQNYGLLVLLAFVVLIGVLYWWSKKDMGKRFLHMIVLKIPVIGTLIQEVNTARTARTLSSLLGSGVEVVEALEITAKVVQNVHFRAVLNEAIATIKKGDLISKTFSEHEKLYPVFFSEMINVGEETGKTGEMLLGVAKYYEEDVGQKTKDMSALIEPVLMIVIGVAVGFFAVSMISPIYSLVNVI